jgi:CMP-N-acetylneuraminic acid synthetase
MTTEIPILIPVKEYSERCNKKNYALLPYTAKYIHSQSMADSTTVITDSIELMELAESLGLNSYLEVRDSYQDELVSCWNFAKAKDVELFFLCPATQPFRRDNLLQQMKQLFEDEQMKRDFITTLSSIQDRQLFFVRETKTGYQFKYNSKNRKGNSCKTEYMIDGVLYLIKTSFLKKVITADDANESFWNGDFTCIKNEAPFMDIDTKEDLEQFRFLKQYFKNSFAHRIL